MPSSTSLRPLTAAALAAAALALACSGSRPSAQPADAPAALLAAAERAAAAAPQDPLALARAGWLRYLIASDPEGALALYARALAAAPADPQVQSEGAALALIGRGEILEDRLDTPAAAHTHAEALRRVPYAAALPVAEFAAQRLVEEQGDSRVVDEAVAAAFRALEAAPEAGAADEPRLPGRAARLVREAQARALGENAPPEGALTESAAWSAAGTIENWRVAGPFAALRLRDLGTMLALDGPARAVAPAIGPAGTTGERSLAFPDGDVGLDLEPTEGDVYYGASDITVEGGDYLAMVEGAAALELRIDGEVAVARTPWPREIPRLQSAAIALAPGAHAVLVRWSRAEGQRFRVTLARADGRSARLQSVAPAQLTGARTKAPCALGQACVRAPAFRDDGGMRGYAERALERDPADPLAAFFLVRATLGDDKPAARVAIDRLVAATSGSAPALLLRQSSVQRDAEVPERIGRSRALADLAEAERKDPLLLRARLLAAALQRDSERYDDAAQELDRAEQAFRRLAAPAAAATSAAAAAATTAATAAPGAAPAAAKAAERLPARLLLSRARLAEVQGNTARALALVRDVLARNEGMCGALQLRAELVRRDGGLAEQLDATRALLPCDGGRVQLGGLLRDRGASAEAEQLARASAEARPAQPGRLEQVADLLVAQKRFADAEAMLRKAAALAPRSAEPLRRLAGVIDLQGEAARADAVRTQALALVPGDLAVRRQLAEARGEKLMPWSDRDGLAIARRPAPPLLPGDAQPSAVMLLDQGAVQLYPDGGVVERVHSIARVLSKRGIQKQGEVQVPPDAQVLHLRTIKADGRVLEPEAITEKEGVSLPGLEPGDAVELDYLRGVGPRGPELPGLTLGAFFFRDDETPLAETTYEVRAPEGLPLELDAHNLAAPAIEHTSGEQRLTHTARDVRPMQPEPGAPAEPETMPWLQIGSGAGEKPFYAALGDWVLLRARPSSALDEIARAAAGATPRQTAERIHAALAQTIRGRSTGNDFGTPAAQVLAQGRGNRVLPLRAALASAGIRSHLVLVRPFGADPAAYRFPRGDIFSYVVLRIELPDGDAWLDPALRLSPFGSLPPWARGRDGWQLPEPGEEPLQLRTPDEAAATDQRTLRFDLALAADGTASGTGRDEHRGYDAAGLKDTLERLDEGQRKQAVESMLGRVLRSVALDRLATEGEGTLGGPAALNFTLHGALARIDGTELRLAASTFPSRLGRRWAQRGARLLPLLVDQPEESLTDSAIALPPGMHLQAAPAPVAVATPFGKFSREVREEGGKLHIHESLSVPLQRISPERYPGFAAFARAVDEAQEAELRLGP